MNNLEKKEFYISILVRYYDFDKWKIKKINSDIFSEKTEEEIEKIASSMVKKQFEKLKNYTKTATSELVELKVETIRPICFYVPKLR